MPWTQNINPFNNLALSALVASIPILFIFWALVIKKMKGYIASLLTLLVAIACVLMVYKMPVQLVIFSTIQGMLYGLIPIWYIIVSALFLFNITVKSSQFEIIKNCLSTITPDRRLQAILIAFSFGSFLEGAAGMGAPVAITAAMLVALGFNPLYAAGICLIANTAPVAFGAVGTPILIASKVTDIPELAISQMVGRTLPFFSAILPFYLVMIIAGFKKSVEVLPAILVSGITFAFFQWVTSNYMGPMLPDVIAGLASIIALVIFLRYWKPKTVWVFKEEPAATILPSLKYSSSEIIRACSPFIIMTIMVVTWGLDPVKITLNLLGIVKINMPGLAGDILQADGRPLVIKPFELNYLSSPGTALLLAGFISLIVTGLGLKGGLQILWATVKQLKLSLITITCVVGFAFLSNYSGMSATIAFSVASTGVLFPFFSPVLGWLGVFLTGSDTSSNALFCKLQYTSANAIGVDPLVTVAANASGGVTGKMISPQSIAIGAAAVGLTGNESSLFLFTAKHSFIMLFLVCVFTMCQAYFIKWIVPSYTMLSQNVSAETTWHPDGFKYLLMMIIVLAASIIAIILFNKKKRIVYKNVKIIN